MYGYFTLLPVLQIVFAHYITVQQYADDNQLFIGLSTATLPTALTHLEHCIVDLNSCFCSNGLCLNAVKLEATLLGAHLRLHSFPSVPSVNIASSTVTVSDKITPHGVTINKYLTLILVSLQFARNPFFIFEL